MWIHKGFAPATPVYPCGNDGGVSALMCLAPGSPETANRSQSWRLESQTFMLWQFDGQLTWLAVELPVNPTLREAPVHPSSIKERGSKDYIFFFFYPYRIVVWSQKYTPHVATVSSGHWVKVCNVELSSESLQEGTTTLMFLLPQRRYLRQTTWVVNLVRWHSECSYTLGNKSSPTYEVTESLRALLIPLCKLTSVLELWHQREETADSLEHQNADRLREKNDQEGSINLPNNGSLINMYFAFWKPYPFIYFMLFCKGTQFKGGQEVHLRDHLCTIHH